MPTNGEYAGFTYYMFNDKIRPSRQLVDLQSDSRELCYELSVLEDREIELRKGYGDNEQIVVLTAEEFKEAVGGTTNKDYETQENTYRKVCKRKRIAYFRQNGGYGYSLFLERRRFGILSERAFHRNDGRRLRLFPP